MKKNSHIPTRPGALRVLLISMPFGALERQALGISLLKTQVVSAGMACDLRYLNFDFADLIGLDNYHWINHALPYTAFAGDWLFTSALYGENPSNDAAYIQTVLREQWQLNDTDLERLLRLRALVPHFIEHTLRSVPWALYDVVGFTSTFEQNIASLALAKNIKTRLPKTQVVFGGANWEGEMGLTLHQQFSFVDVVCSGEAEESFPAVLHAIAAQEPLGAVRGIVYRDETGRSLATGPADLIRELNRVPAPDYSDYFRDLEASDAASEVVPSLLYESSRGCWWGAKSHCTFCGLNGGSLAYRSKSPERVLQELFDLSAQWSIDHIEMVDNILDMKYFESVLPALAKAKNKLQVFYEIKANLSREQVAALAAAGVYRVQPGIESLSDHVLTLMRKGTTGLRNVQLLKWCREYSIKVDWNILYGFPGETAEDYATMLGLLRSIVFLEAPSACGPIRLDRFSPYFENPSAYGFGNLRPIAPYAHLYPFETKVLKKLAYYFDFDHDNQKQQHAQDVIGFARWWQENPDPGALRGVYNTNGDLVLLDTRRDALHAKTVLSGTERALYEHCDAVRSPKGLRVHLESAFNTSFDEAEIRRCLDSMVANRLMVSDGTHYLALALGVKAQTAPEHAAAQINPLHPERFLNLLPLGQP